MERFGELWRRLLFLFRRGQFDRDLEEEMRLHLEMKARQNREAGMDPEEARHAARRKFGNVTLAKEASRESYGWTRVESLIEDLRYAQRSFRRTPGFTAVALLTLALGIGVNTAVFSLLYDSVFENLPVSRPQELVQLAWVQRGRTGTTFNWPDYQPLLEPQPALPGLFAYLDREASLRSGAASERIRAHLVSGSYFPALGTGAIIGRMLGAADDRPGAAPAAVLSYAYWQRRFALNASVLGTTVYLDGTPFTIVGVMRPEFYGLNRLSPPDVACPLHAVELPGGGSYYVYYFARLNSGVSLPQARAQAGARFRRLLETELRGGWMGRVTLDVLPAATGEYYTRFQVQQPLRVLGISVAIVLLICCANIASLLLGRAAARTREIAIRCALGASRRRIIRQLLTESVLLGFGGGCLGLVVGYWVHRLLRTFFAVNDSAMDFRLHLPLLAFTFAVSVLTGMLFGLAPALRATRLGLYAAARGGAPAGRLRLGPTRTFLVVQVAASVVLLMGAVLFVRTLRNLKTVDAGFDREQLVLMNIDPRESRFQGDRIAGLLDEIMERARTVPGVRSASLAQSVLFGQSAVKNVWVEDHTGGGSAGFNIVGPGFFATAGMPLVMGHEFSQHDRAGAPLVAIVNQAFAREYFPGRNPVGRRFGDKGPKSAGKYEIVGVVKDARHTNLRFAPRPAIFQSLWQFAAYPPFVLHARVSGEPADTAARIRREIQAIDSRVAVYGIRTMTEQVNTTLRAERMFATLSALFGALALGLCSIGLYGLAAYSVRCRTSEIGIRMALGASRSSVLWLVLRDSLVLVSIGIAIGTPAALACTTFMKRLLFGLTPGDPGTVALAMIMLAGVAVTAALVPARRATRINPIEALRHD